MDADDKPPPNICVLPHSIAFPVYATSPDSSRYHRWVKTRAAIMIGMPLWNNEELNDG